MREKQTGDRLFAVPNLIGWQGVRALVVHEPEQKDGPFPKDGVFIIYSNGKTKPPNLKEKVKEVRRLGWNVSKELLEVLNIEPTGGEDT